MLLDLYNLFKKSNEFSTPLEDFTTECFAGLLQQHKEVFKTYIMWLGLPLESYKIKTQVKYALENDLNCIVDLVLESVNTICFIEIKVNSKEGWRQLERYSNVLDKINKKNKHLNYCTKNFDSKNIEKHNFKQYRWNEIATLFIKNHKEIPLVLDFNNYLKKHEMAQDSSITTNTIIALQNFMQTYTAMEYHIQNAIPSFKSHFSKAKLEKEDSLSKIRDFDRVGRLVKGIIDDKKYHSEILYCIHFETVKLQTQIWISSAHPEIEKLKKLVKNNTILKHWIDDNGLGIFLDCKLYSFIDDKDADEKIKIWFNSSFEVIKNFISESVEVNWDFKTLY